MKAEDFRIGNKLYSPIQKEHITLIAIEQGNRPIVLGKNGTSSYSGFDCLHPIELTEEMLLKCGFGKSDEHEMGYNDNPHFGFYYDYHFKKFRLEVDDYISYAYVDLNIKYLHQLQNLYYSLTNRELNIEL